MPGWEISADTRLGDIIYTNNMYGSTYSTASTIYNNYIGYTTNPLYCYYNNDNADADRYHWTTSFNPYIENFINNINKIKISKTSSFIKEKNIVPFEKNFFFSKENCHFEELYIFLCFFEKDLKRDLSVYSINLKKYLIDKPFYSYLKTITKENLFILLDSLYYSKQYVQKELF